MHFFLAILRSCRSTETRDSLCGELRTKRGTLEFQSWRQFNRLAHIIRLHSFSLRGKSCAYCINQVIFCLAYGEMGRILKVKSKSIEKMLFPRWALITIAAHLCPWWSCVVCPFGNSERAVMVIQVPRNQIKPGNIQERQRGKWRQNDGYSRERNQKAIGGLAVGRRGFSPC